MNKDLLDQKINLLYSYSEVDPAVTERIKESVLSGDDWLLRRINPYRFAESCSLDSAKAVNVFLYASRIGLFDLSWNLVCPSCGGVLNRNNSLNDLGEGTKINHCAVFSLDVPINIDDYVEVSLSINPKIRKEEIDPLQRLWKFQKILFSPNFERSPELAVYAGAF